MKIKTIDIDGFGVWNGLKIEDLTDNTTVVYGPNEAGKTTLMQFVRAVLYGYTPERRKKYLPPVNGGKPGGRLLLADSVGQFLAHRTASIMDVPEDTGPLTIVDDRGEQRDPMKLADLLAGVDEPTYNNVFAIGLKEIQELGSLDETAAADYLYKLTSGLDRVSLIDVLREVNEAREGLLASGEEQPSKIPSLLERRGELRKTIDEQVATTGRWSDVATLRQTLADEAAELERQIGEIEAGSHVVRAALDVQNVWNMRADLLRQLELLKDVRQLPDKAVEKLDACLKRIGQCRTRLAKLAGRRNRYRKEVASLEINRLLLNHASRIEALHDQSQWIIALENQLLKLREEVKRLDDEIDAAVNGFSKSAGGQSKSLDELPRETVAVLRRPSQAIREENEKLEKAKQEADEAKRAFDQAVAQYDSAGRSKQVPDLNRAIQEAENKVSLLKRRLQVEERLDQLGRRREELKFDSEELHQYDEAPVRITALLGLVFAVGVALLLFGLVGGSVNWVSSGWPWAMFGSVFVLAAIGGKLLIERHSEDNITDTHRHLEQLRMQLADANRERDEIDAELPSSGGSLDSRLREAEIELRDLERLIPVRTERESAEQRHKAAQLRLAAAQEAVKEAKHRWRNALRSVGLPEDFAPMKVKAVVRSNAGVLDLRRRRDSRKDELDQREREMMILNSRIQQILDDVRMTSAGDKPLLRIRDLVAALTKEKETLELRTQVEKKLRRLTKERGRVVLFLRKAERRRQALLARAGVDDDKSFRKVAADAERAADLRRQQSELTLRIRQQLAGQFTEESIAVVFESEGRDIRPGWDRRQKELQEIRAKLAHIHERRGACTHEMQAMAADKQLSFTLQELDEVERDLAASIRRWKVLTVIGQVLEVVRKRFETDRQPQTLREASEYLHRLTGGHYRRVWMPLDGRTLVVETDKGESLSLDLLSRGTREAVFIALRLALVTSFARRGTTLPLVLDDVLVNFDSGRVRAAAEVLCDFARSGHQIIMFTCHEHITDIFEEAKADIRQLPHRGGEVDARPTKRRKRKVEPVADLTPPPPPVAPDEPPVRIAPPIDPNPLLQQAAAEEQWFDDVYDVPKKEKKRKSRYKIVPRDWNRDTWPLVRVPIKVEPSTAAEPRIVEKPAVSQMVVVTPSAATFEVLAYRMPTLEDQIPVRESIPTTTATTQIVIAPAQPTPPAPKMREVRRQRHRFTWESPEMYTGESENND